MHILNAEKRLNGLCQMHSGLKAQSAGSCSRSRLGEHRNHAQLDKQAIAKSSKISIIARVPIHFHAEKPAGRRILSLVSLLKAQMYAQTKGTKYRWSRIGKRYQ